MSDAISKDLQAAYDSLDAYVRECSEDRRIKPVTCGLPEYWLLADVDDYTSQPCIRVYESRIVLAEYYKYAAWIDGFDSEDGDEAMPFAEWLFSEAGKKK